MPRPASTSPSGCASWACWRSAWLLLVLLPSQQAGAWQAPRFQADWSTRLREGRTEGQLLLRFETADLWFAAEAGRCTAELDLRIEARTPAGFTPWAGHFRRSLEGDDQSAHRLAFAPPLAAGTYELRIAVADVRGGGLWTRSLTIVVQEWSGGWQLASLLLTEPGTAQPWVGAVAPDGVARLGWQTQLHAPKARPLQVETVLFRRETDAASELALPFRAVHEQREVVAVRAGVQPLRRSLPIAGLEPGEYLLLVQLWEGDRRVAEQSRRLVLRWPEVGAVLARVETALDQLGAVAAPAVPMRSGPRCWPTGPNRPSTRLTTPPKPSKATTAAWRRPTACGPRPTARAGKPSGGGPGSGLDRPPAANARAASNAGITRSCAWCWCSGRQRYQPLRTILVKGLCLILRFCSGVSIEDCCVAKTISCIS